MRRLYMQNHYLVVYILDGVVPEVQAGWIYESLAVFIYHVAKSE